MHGPHELLWAASRGQQHWGARSLATSACAVRRPSFEKGNHLPQLAPHQGLVGPRSTAVAPAAAMHSQHTEVSNILHDALYGARAHAMRATMIRGPGPADKAGSSHYKSSQQAVSEEMESATKGDSTPDAGMLASSSAAALSSPWQADLVAELTQGSNQRAKPASGALQQQAGPSYRPSAAYGNLVQDRAGYVNQRQSSAALMQLQQQTKHLATAAIGVASSGSSSQTNFAPSQQTILGAQGKTDLRDVVRTVAAVATRHAQAVAAGLTATAASVPGLAESALYQRLQPSAGSTAGQPDSKHSDAIQQQQMQTAQRAAPTHTNHNSQPAVPGQGQHSPAYKRWQSAAQSVQQPIRAQQQQQQQSAGRAGALSSGRHSGSTTGAACSSNDSTTAFLDCNEELMPLEESSAPGSSPPSASLGLVRSQCYVYRPISYPDHMSADALKMANAIMTRLTIPGGIKYKQVQYNSKWYHQGCRFGFTAFSMCLGSSYFQRLLAGMPHLEYAVRRSGPSYADYLECMAPCSERRWASLHAQFGGQYGSSTQVTEESTLASIQFACVYLACKLVDRMPMLEMLRYILTTLYGSVVSKAQAYDVESKCLEGLGFRLGPYFRTDELEPEWPF